MTEAPPLTCWSCRHVRVGEAGWLWCEPFKRRAVKICLRFSYEPGADERERDEAYAA